MDNLQLTIEDNAHHSYPPSSAREQQLRSNTLSPPQRRPIQSDPFETEQSILRDIFNAAPDYHPEQDEDLSVRMRVSWQKVNIDQMIFSQRVRSAVQYHSLRRTPLSSFEHISASLLSSPYTLASDPSAAYNELVQALSPQPSNKLDHQQKQKQLLRFLQFL